MFWRSLAAGTQRHRSHGSTRAWLTLAGLWNFYLRERGYSIVPLTVSHQILISLENTRMHLLPILLCTLPTLVWMLVWFSIRPRQRSVLLLVTGMAIGASLAVPVWFAESFVDDFANSTDRWSRDFIEQVLSAAFCEELLKFVAVIGILKWIQPLPADREIAVPVALSVGIGFMTVENGFAMWAADSSMSMALSRQMTLLAGHPGYQLVMGFCLARWSVERRKRWMFSALAIPILLHGWGDFSEQLFKDEPDHGSTRDTIEFLTWIGSIAATFTASLVILVGAFRRSRQ